MQVGVEGKDLNLYVRINSAVRLDRVRVSDVVSEKGSGSAIKVDDGVKPYPDGLAHPCNILKVFLRVRRRR